MKNKFLKSGFIYFIGNILLRGINFFTLPIFTRLMLPEDYGLYSLYSASVGILSIFIGLQINGTVSISYGKKNMKDFERYVANISIFPLIVFFISLILLLIFPFLIDVIQVPFLMFGIMLMIQSFLGVIISIYMAELIIKKLPKKHLLFSLATTLLNVFLSLSFVLLFINDTYFARVIAGIIANGLIGVYIFRKYIPRIDYSLLKKDWSEGLKLSLPLIFHNLSSQVLNVADRYMISYWRDAVEIAIYSFSYNLGLIISMIWQSINNAWVPWYFDHLKNENTKLIKSYSKQYIIFFSWLTLGFMLFSPELVYIMGGYTYELGIYIVPLIVLGYFFTFLYSFYANYQFYQQRTTLIPIATMSAALINILLNKILIPPLGIIGAALTTAISYFFMLIFHYFMTVYILKHRDFPDSQLFKAIIVIILGTFVVYKTISYFYIRLIMAILLTSIYGVYILLSIKSNRNIV